MIFIYSKNTNLKYYFNMKKKSILNVKGTPITVIKQDENDFISLTDMVKNFDGVVP